MAHVEAQLAFPTMATLLFDDQRDVYEKPEGTDLRGKGGVCGMGTEKPS